MAYGLATVLLWSTMATAFKLTLQHLAPGALVLWASVVSTGALAALVTLQEGRRGLAATLRGLLRGEWRMALALGLVNPAAYYMALFEAYDRLPAQVAQPVNYTWAITLTLLSACFLKKRVTAAEWTAMVVGYAGVVVIAWRGEGFASGSLSLVGVALALLSTVLWAGYWVASARDTRRPLRGLLQNFLLGTPCVAAWLAVRGELGEALAPAWAGLAGAAYIGALEMGVSFALWLAALKRAEHVATISMLIFLAPPLSLWIIHTVLGEAIHPNTFWGLGCILMGLALQHAAHRRRVPERPGGKPSG